MKPLLLAGFACALACAQTGLPPKGTLASARRRSLVAGGMARSYLVQPVAGAGPFPIVILLHGGEQGAAAVWTQTSLPTLGAPGSTSSWLLRRR